MTPTITYDAGTLPTPLLMLVDTFVQARTSMNRVHKLAAGGISYTLGSAARRKSVLTLLYADPATAADAFAALCLPTVFAIADADTIPPLLTFIVDEDADITSVLDPDTRRRVTIRVPFVEVG